MNKPFKVHVGVMNTSVGTDYLVLVDHPDRPTGASPWDKGRMCLATHKLRRVADMDVEIWQNFFDGVDKTAGDVIAASFEKPECVIDDPIKALTESLNWAVNKIEMETCTHETTHRGGGIWTICDDCLQSWADDRGGFKPYVDPPELVRARDLLDRFSPPPTLLPRK